MTHTLGTLFGGLVGWGRGGVPLGTPPSMSAVASFEGLQARVESMALQQLLCVNCWPCALFGV